MSIAIFDMPLPVVVIENGVRKDGYAIYVESGKTFENDIWCIALGEGGIVRHYRSDQIRIHKNSTFEINEQQESKEIKKSRKSNSSRETRRGS
jgi:hypothetical protein